jgi:hypothetical protein
MKTSWPAECCVHPSPPPHSKENFSDPLVEVLRWQKCTKVQNSEHSFSFPWKELGNCGTADLKRDITNKAKSSVSPLFLDVTLRFECLTCHLDIKNSGDWGLNFVNHEMPIFPPVKTQITYLWTNGRSNFRIGRNSLSASTSE